LLHGFDQRIKKKQPIVAPNDIRRYFVTPQESGELCLMSCIFGENRDIFFPKLNEELNLITFEYIALKYLEALGYQPYLCNSEEEARISVDILSQQKKWPCFFTKSDTTGEKDFEEFYTEGEVLDMDRFESIGIIKNSAILISEKIDRFVDEIKSLKKGRNWNKKQIIDLFFEMIPGFEHKETGKYLDSKM
jgi:FlaA1/EpsC-like NDP-sugar epimerase